jgi:hypothetical protein
MLLLIFYGVSVEVGEGTERLLTLDRSIELGASGNELDCRGVEFGDGILLI